MNRLPSVSSAPETTSVPSGVMSAGMFSPVAGEHPCTLFAPLHYEKNYAYPLLVWLHGPTDDENQLKRIMPLVSLRNYVAVGLRGTTPSPTPSRRRAFSWAQSSADISLAEQRLFDAIELARERYHIGSERIFIGGYDVGGTMALRLAMNHPREFAGVLSVCGAFPQGQTPLARVNAVRRLPIFLACGRDSVSYPAAQVCDNLRLFHTAGLQVALRQYPCEQELTTLMLSDMDRWMMDLVTAPAVCA